MLYHRQESAMAKDGMKRMEKIDPSIEDESLNFVLGPSRVAAEATAAGIATPPLLALKSGTLAGSARGLDVKDQIGKVFKPGITSEPAAGLAARGASMVPPAQLFDPSRVAPSSGLAGKAVWLPPPR